MTFRYGIVQAVTAYDITTTTLRLTRAKRQSMPSHVAKLKTALLMFGLLLAPIGMALGQSTAANLVSSIDFKLGADHPLDKYLYRPIEPALKWLLR